MDPQVTKTQSSGEGCKILLSESIRERAVFNGVRGSRRHRACGALDPVKLSSPLLHGVGPSARSACAAARSQQHRRRDQPVDSTQAQACSIRRSQSDSNAVAGPDGARSSRVLLHCRANGAYGSCRVRSPHELRLTDSVVQPSVCAAASEHNVMPLHACCVDTCESIR